MFKTYYIAICLLIHIIGIRCANHFYCQICIKLTISTTGLPLHHRIVHVIFTVVFTSFEFFLLFFCRIISFHCPLFLEKNLQSDLSIRIEYKHLFSIGTSEAVGRVMCSCAGHVSAIHFLSKICIYRNLQRLLIFLTKCK